MQSNLVLITLSRMLDVLYISQGMSLTPEDTGIMPFGGGIVGEPSDKAAAVVGTPATKNGGKKNREL